MIEGLLLWAYENMRGIFGTPTITQIYYEVVADYNRQPREGTQELHSIVMAYEEAVERVRAKSVAEGGSGEAEPTHQQVMVELALNPPSAHLSDAMRAVAAKNGANWRKVHQRLEGNQNLWAFEDANVPRALLIKYSWIENGVLRGPWRETVSIILPTSLAARFEA